MLRGPLMKKFFLGWTILFSSETSTVYIQIVRRQLFLYIMYFEEIFQIDE